MILVFDIGNSNIVLGICDNDKVLKTYRYESLEKRTSDEYYLAMKNYVEKYEIDGAIISSVVPILTSRIKKMIETYFNIKPILVSTKLDLGIDLLCDNPREVGADIIAATVGAYIKYKKSSLIVDLGTANKIIYQKNNSLSGLVITPGVKTSLNALTNSTALLPTIEMEVPKNVLGLNTIDCMQSGTTYGVASAIDGLVKRIKKEINEDVMLIATGGLSKLIIPLCEDKYVLYPNLILDGLIYLYNKNKA